MTDRTTKFLLTLVAITVVFVLQQYGGSGAAETFGAGGLADDGGALLFVGALIGIQVERFVRRDKRR